MSSYNALYLKLLQQSKQYIKTKKYIDNETTIRLNRLLNSNRLEHFQSSPYPLLSLRSWYFFSAATYSFLTEGEDWTERSTISDFIWKGLGQRQMKAAIIITFLDNYGALGNSLGINYPNEVTEVLQNLVRYSFPSRQMTSVKETRFSTGLPW